MLEIKDSTDTQRLRFKTRDLHLCVSPPPLGVPIKPAECKEALDRLGRQIQAIVKLIKADIFSSLLSKFITSYPKKTQ